MKSIQPICARVQSADSCHCTKTDGWSALCLAVVSAGTLLAQPAYFTRITDGPIATDTERSYGCALVDNDHDGFLDLFVSNGPDEPASPGEVNFLYRNDARAHGNTNGWLLVRLVGTASNRSAIGAKVRVKAVLWSEEVWQMREISGGSGLCSQNDLRAHFGLGDATVVDTLRVEWPSGNVQELTDVAPNQLLTVTEQVRITPVRPSSSLGGSVTLTAQLNGTWQWYHDGNALDSQTARTLALSNIQTTDAGRYSAVVTTASGTFTNHVHLLVDTQFTKITEGPAVTDLGRSWGASWGDYDNDGYLDLSVGRSRLGTSCIYLNNRDGTFSRLADPPGLETVTSLIHWGDFDNDGLLDLLVWRSGPLATWVAVNDGQGGFSPMGWSYPNDWWGCAAADYDRDGLLDLFFTRPNRLCRNLGNRSFAILSTAEAGSLVSLNTFGGGCWGDLDDDGWPDLYVPSHRESRSYMFRNLGTGRFEPVTNLVTRTAAPALVGAWGDYDNDGRLDLVVASFNGTSTVYRNLGNGEFERPVGAPTLNGTHNFAAWIDFDNDGFLDLSLSGYQSGNKLFRNLGNGVFAPITTGSPVNERSLNNAGTYALAWSDYDNDGFLDLYVCNGEDSSTIWTANQLYHNNGNDNAWLTVKLVGTISNRDAVGAKVRALATYAGAARWQRRDISGGEVVSGNHRYAHFGLGDAMGVSRLRIEWPSGTIEEFSNLAPNRYYTIVEPSLRGAMKPQGEFELSVWASTNRTCTIESSADLVTWTTFTTVPGQGETPVTVTDPAAPGQGQRFYRMK